jgi:hypothetical protein
VRGGPARVSAGLAAALALAAAVLGGTGALTVGVGLVGAVTLVYGALRSVRPAVLLGTAGLFGPPLYGATTGIDPLAAVAGATAAALAYDAASRAAALRRRVGDGVDTRAVELVGAGAALCVAAATAPLVYALSVTAGELPAAAAAAALLAGLVVAAWLVRNG